jgi:hypothetical protein
MKTGVNEDMFKLPGGVRVSFSFYNTLGEAYRLIQALKKCSKALPVFFDALDLNEQGMNKAYG